MACLDEYIFILRVTHIDGFVEFFRGDFNIVMDFYDDIAYIDELNIHTDQWDRVVIFY